MKYLYLVLCVVGTLIPLSFFVPFLTQHGTDFGLFMQQLWANDISRFFAADLVIASIASWCMMAREAQRRNIRYWWIAMACTFVVGLSLALPLFLFMRELKIESDTARRYGHELSTGREVPRGI
jgi:Terpene cyclase DEP1